MRPSLRADTTSVIASVAKQSPPAFTEMAGERLLSTGPSRLPGVALRFALPRHGRAHPVPAELGSLLPAIPTAHCAIGDPGLRDAAFAHGGDDSPAGLRLALPNHPRS